MQELRYKNKNQLLTPVGFYFYYVTHPTFSPQNFKNLTLNFSRPFQTGNVWIRIQVVTSRTYISFTRGKLQKNFNVQWLLWTLFHLTFDSQIVSYTAVCRCQFRSKINKPPSKMTTTHLSFRCLRCRRRKMVFNISSKIFCISKYVIWITSKFMEKMNLTAFFK